MEGIYAADGALITDHIRDAEPKYKSKKVNHELLDGTFVMQTIGSPFKVLEVNAFANREAVDRINYAEAVGERIRVAVLGVEYRGYIETAPLWTYSAVNYYETTLTLLVDGEGAI